MFAVCLSFLIFAGSTFILLGDLIKSQLENQIGADLLAFTTDYSTMKSFINEIETTEFLQQNQDIDGSVVGWTYVAPAIHHIFQALDPNLMVETMFADFSAFKQFDVSVYSVEQNFLDVTIPKFYMPNEIEEELISEFSDEIRRLDNGKFNAVDAIYSNGTLKDIGDSRDQHNLTVSNRDEVDSETSTDEIKIIIPEGFRDVLALDSSRGARLCFKYGYDPNW